jgi:hypothetical protein
MLMRAAGCIVPIDQKHVFMATARVVVEFPQGWITITRGSCRLSVRIRQRMGGKGEGF